MYDIHWNIKFNPIKSQLMTFGMRVKYPDVHLLCISGITDSTCLMEHGRKFYGHFNNIMSVLGKGHNEIAACPNVL